MNSSDNSSLRRFAPLAVTTFAVLSCLIVVSAVALRVGAAVNGHPMQEEDFNPAFLFLFITMICSWIAGIAGAYCSIDRATTISAVGFLASLISIIALATINTVAHDAARDHAPRAVAPTVTAMLDWAESGGYESVIVQDGAHPVFVRGDERERARVTHSETWRGLYSAAVDVSLFKRADALSLLNIAEQVGAGGCSSYRADDAKVEICQVGGDQIVLRLDH